MEKIRKWYIYNMEHEPLCWNGHALEFDTREDAETFFRSIPTDMIENEMLVIVEDVLYYNWGYINASGYIVKFTDDDDAYLVEGE